MQLESASLVPNKNLEKDSRVGVAKNSYIPHLYCRRRFAINGYWKFTRQERTCQTESRSIFTRGRACF